MRVLIVDDEALAVRRLERLTRSILVDDLKEIVSAHSLTQAAQSLAANRFDLILLDLNIAGEDGFKLLAANKAAASVIVVSAFPDRAIEAFSHAVLDFVPKPVEEERLRLAVQRVPRLKAAPAPERMAVRNLGRIEFVEINLIVRISGADDYSEILLVDGRRLLCDQRLNELESALPNQFARVHRSHVVNWDQVSSVDTTQAHPTLVHPSGAKTPVSRRRLNLVRERLKQK